MIKEATTIQSITPLTVMMRVGTTELGSAMPLYGMVEMGGKEFRVESDSIETLVGHMKNLLASSQQDESETWMTNNIIALQYELTAFVYVYGHIFNQRVISTITGINPSLLSQYLTGKAKPSAKQSRRMEDAFRALGSELMSIHITNR